MAPSIRTSACLRALMVIVTLPLLAGLSAPAAIADGEPVRLDKRVDKEADVFFVGRTSPAQTDSVDVLGVTCEVGTDAVTITSRFVDLADTNGHQFVESHVLSDGDSFVLSSQVGRKRVFLYPPAGHGYGAAPGVKCLGSRSLADFDLDTVTQVVPLECWNGATEVRVKTASVLVTRHTTEIARDKAARSQPVALD